MFIEIIGLSHPLHLLSLFFSLSISLMSFICEHELTSGIESYTNFEHKHRILMTDSLAILMITCLIYWYILRSIHFV